MAGDNGLWFYGSFSRQDLPSATAEPPTEGFRSDRIWSFTWSTDAGTPSFRFKFKVIGEVPGAEVGGGAAEETECVSLEAGHGGAPSYAAGSVGSTSTGRTAARTSSRVTRKRPPTRYARTFPP